MGVSFPTLDDKSCFLDAFDDVGFVDGNVSTLVDYVDQMLAKGISKCISGLE